MANIFDKENEKNEGKVKVVKKSSFLGELLGLILILCICLFAYKKIMIDYDGQYATNRLTYTEEYGFCLLITYHPSYQTGQAKGFVITNIPFTSLFSEKIHANKNGDDMADSKEYLDVYQLIATFGDNDFANTMVKALSNSGVSTKSFDIGSNGKYFIIQAKDAGF